MFVFIQYLDTRYKTRLLNNLIKRFNRNIQFFIINNKKRKQIDAEFTINYKFKFYVISKNK